MYKSINKNTIYKMHRHINTDADIIQVHCQNKSFTKIYIYIYSNAKHTWGAHILKCTNVSHIT